MRDVMEHAPRALVLDGVREALARARAEPASAPADDEAWATAVRDAVTLRTRPSLRAAFNATGVVLHTNLGRAPLADAALDAIRRAAEASCNLEYDLEAGARGQRDVHCRSLLVELTGAEDAMVVNNCAAALVLALDTFAAGRDAIVSRGELVEIGGSFRVPDIMAKGGARLVEVGTTNRTHLDDYRRALRPESGAIVKVHRSNFALEGFVAEAAVAELAALGAERAVPVIHDFGSGLLLPLEAWGLRGEPTLRDAVAAGPSVVLASGDKLLGGPQCGLVLGRADMVSRMRRNPLARALRVDKLTLAALEATLALYRDPERAVRDVPALAMLTAPATDVARRAGMLADRLTSAGVGGVGVADTVATVGGGAFPTARIPSSAVRVGARAVDAERALRHGTVPVIGRLADGALLLDPRGVPARHDAAFLDAVATALAPRRA